MKFFLLISLSLCFLVGCSYTASKGTDSHNSTPQMSNENPAKDLVGIYGGTKEDENAFYYSDYTVQEDRRFFLEDNPCIFKEYMLALVVIVTENEYSIEIGSHCNEDPTNKENGGMIKLQKNNSLIVESNNQFNIFDKIKIYYEFPDNFEPDSYLDYMNYATKIEK